MTADILLHPAFLRVRKVETRNTYIVFIVLKTPIFCHFSFCLEDLRRKAPLCDG